MTIPNTLANLSGSIQLSLLDDNFTYLDAAIATAVVGATSFVNVATLVAGAGATGATGSITGASFKTSNWTITGASGATGALYFSIGGVNKAKLDIDGNFSVTGDVIAFETIT
jgi:hypothetical protein